MGVWVHGCMGGCMRACVCVYVFTTLILTDALPTDSYEVVVSPEIASPETRLLSNAFLLEEEGPCWGPPTHTHARTHTQHTRTHTHAHPSVFTSSCV